MKFPSGYMDRNVPGQTNLKSQISYIHINFLFKMCLKLFCFVTHVSYSLQSNWNQIVDSFDEMSLREALLRGIYAYGFEKPSAIQQRAIVPCIKGK